MRGPCSVICKEDVSEKESGEIVRYFVNGKICRLFKILQNQKNEKKCESPTTSYFFCFYVA